MTMKTKLSETDFSINITRSLVEKKLEHFLINEDHPCVMAQSLFKQERIIFDIYGAMQKNHTASLLLKNIERYLTEYNFDNNRYQSYLAVFPKDTFRSEQEFEDALWILLQNLHIQDDKPWDKSVSSDSNDENFSFSIKGKAFYIVGMHPESSRNARKSPYPMIAFNLHWQFEQLREHELYGNVRDTIRERDKERNGSINPVLRDFGTASEALQYSGKRNNEKWKCPFHKV